MQNTCSKCGIGIPYGVMCGYCRLNSDITSTFTNNTNGKYNLATPQNNYSPFRNSLKSSLDTDRNAKESALKKYLMNPKQYTSTITKDKNNAHTFNKNDRYVFNFKEYLPKDSIDSKVADYKHSAKSEKFDYAIILSKDDNSSNYIINIIAVPVAISNSYTIPYASRSQIPLGRPTYVDGKYSKKKYYNTNDGGTESNGKYSDNKGTKNNNGSKGSSKSAN